MLGGLGPRVAVWAGKHYLICTGPARCFFKRVSGILLYIYGPSVPLLPSLPSLWHDVRTSGKEKRLAPLWSGP